MVVDDRWLGGVGHASTVKIAEQLLLFRVDADDGMVCVEVERFSVAIFSNGALRSLCCPIVRFFCGCKKSTAHCVS